MQNIQAAIVQKSKTYSDLYTGDFKISGDKSFINIKSETHEDTALIILYATQKKKDSSYLEELRRKKRSKAKITETSYRKLVKIKPDINDIECKIIFLKKIYQHVNWFIEKAIGSLLVSLNKNKLRDQIIFKILK